MEHQPLGEDTRIAFLFSCTGIGHYTKRSRLWNKDYVLSPFYDTEPYNRVFACEA